MNASQVGAAPPTSGGLFVCFEGGDGCGKSTQVAALVDHLRAVGLDPLVTREPGGTALGARLRDLVLHGPAMDARTEALLYAADRAEHAAAVIRPALASGRVVVTDRYMDSSIAYQGAARDLGDAARALSMWAVDGLVPDLTIVLDADPRAVRARLGASLDRLESEPLAFHDAVRAGFLACAAEAPERYLVLDALQSADAIAARVRDAVRERLPRPGVRSS